MSKKKNNSKIEEEIEPAEEKDQQDNESSVMDEKTLVLAKDTPPSTLPIVPLSERPLFPKMISPIIVGEDHLKTMIKKQLKHPGGAYLGLLLIKADMESDIPEPRKPEELYKVGVVAKIMQMRPLVEDAPLQMIIQVLDRFEVIEFIEETPNIFARVKFWEEDNKTVIDEEMKAYSVSIINAIKELVQLKPMFKEELNLLITRFNVNEPGHLADFSASLTTASGEDLQKILATRDILSRLDQVLILLKKELEISRLQVKINKRIEERLSKQQREFFLKQQLKEIKQELGLSKGDKEAEFEKIEHRLKKLTLTKEAEERIKEELDKMKLLEPSSPEFNVTRAYLDWLTILPWGIYTKDNYDIKQASDQLNQDHYGLTDVKERILELISVGIKKGALSGSIILMVGPPGVGKTSVGQSIAKSVGREFYRFSLGGMRDEAEIKGHRRTYIGALPGKFIQAMKTCKTANPVIMLDEIDKIGASFQGDPASALLEVLDPEQNKEFLDHYLDVRFDLSKVLFICTANQLETIPAALLDRMELIRLSGYILEEKLQIARQYLIPKQLEQHGLKENSIPFAEDVLREIIDGYSREAGVRGLENNIKKLMRKATKRMVEENIEKVKFPIKDIPKLLGKRLFSEDQLYKKPKAGVITGLAYTSMGGATLYIEATNINTGSPGFKQTGQLGKVMVESSEIAYTYIRSRSCNDKNTKDFFEKNFVHLHVPAGATPKDGPSAGITMACALYSLATQKAIKKNFAMTGELSLTGLVMPIGGVKEKTIAAKRAKVTHLIFPSENKTDFEELDAHIKKDITPHFVDNFDDVIKICF